MFLGPLSPWHANVVKIEALYMQLWISLTVVLWLYYSDANSSSFYIISSESRGQEKAGLRDEPVSYLQVANLLTL